MLGNGKEGLTPHALLHKGASVCIRPAFGYSDAINAAHTFR